MIDLFETERECPPILGFFAEYRFLSNYHLCHCMIGGISFPSSEHAYMFQKSNDPEYQLAIFNAQTPKEARKIGQTAVLRRDWVIYRKTAMLRALESKFYSGSKELEMLLATKDAYLEETNHWNDTYWGVCNGVGENQLGKLLMKIRDKHNG